MGAVMTYYGLLTPSGIVVPMGREKPKLSREMKRDFWKVVRVKSILPKPNRNRAGKPPCGECHLQPGETCDICKASSPLLLGSSP
jgi:hypothetical protein